MVVLLPYILSGRTSEATGDAPTELTAMTEMFMGLWSGSRTCFRTRGSPEPPGLMDLLTGICSHTELSFFNVSFKISVFSWKRWILPLENSGS